MSIRLGKKQGNELWLLFVSHLCLASPPPPVGSPRPATWQPGCDVKMKDRIAWCMRAKLCPSLCNPMDCSPPGSSVHRDFRGKNIKVDCHFLLQGMFLTHRLNLCLLHLLHWQADSLPPSHLGSPELHGSYKQWHWNQTDYIWNTALPSGLSRSVSSSIKWE